MNNDGPMVAEVYIQSWVWKSPYILNNLNQQKLLTAGPREW